MTINTSQLSNTSNDGSRDVYKAGGLRTRKDTRGTGRQRQRQGKRRRRRRRDRRRKRGAGGA